MESYTGLHIKYNTETVSSFNNQPNKDFSSGYFLATINRNSCRFPVLLITSAV